MRLAVEKSLDGAANQRGARGAADEDDFFHVRGLELGVSKGLLDRAHRAVNHRADESIERAASEFVCEYGTVRQREAKRGRL